MWDAVYVLITLLFFAAMLWYVDGCERLRGEANGKGARDDPDAGVRGDD